MLIFHGALATASHHYPLIAVLAGNQLLIHETPLIQSRTPRYSEPIHQINLDPVFAAKVKSISFSSPSPQESPGPRVLLASDTTVHVYSALPEEPPFHASILNAASPSPTLQSAAFISPSEVILVPELAPRITIRDITSGLGIELRDVKHTSTINSDSDGSRNHAYSIRSSSGHIGFLTRPSVGKDIIVILSRQGSGESTDVARPRAVELEYTVLTSDAQDLAFSPDGAWLAIQDIATAPQNQDESSGGHICIYTPSGSLYKHWHDSKATDKDLSLGVERFAWLVDGRLAIGTVDNRVVLLLPNTFEEQATIRHPSVLKTVSASNSIWAEEIDTATLKRSYTLASLPAAPPASVASVTGEVSLKGITHLACSSDGSMLASVSGQTPTTAWLTDISGDRIQTRAVLIHHSPIRTIQWHPTRPRWLLIETTQKRVEGTYTAHVWCADLPEPMIITAALPAEILHMRSAVTSKPAHAKDAKGLPIGASWLLPVEEALPDSIPDILFTFKGVASTLSALPMQESEDENTILAAQFEETPPRDQAELSHKLTQKTPIRGKGPEDAFDQSFEDLRAESLAQSVSESVTDGGFSPVKFDATDWTRRQVLGEPEDEDDTFVGKGKR